ASVGLSSKTSIRTGAVAVARISTVYGIFGYFFSFFDCAMRFPSLQERSMFQRSKILALECKHQGLSGRLENAFIHAVFTLMVSSWSSLSRSYTGGSPKKSDQQPRTVISVFSKGVAKATELSG